jgi:hypothetical protein
MSPEAHGMLSRCPYRNDVAAWAALTNADRDLLNTLRYGTRSGTEAEIERLRDLVAKLEAVA